jgi:hypothetical protein
LIFLSVTAWRGQIENRIFEQIVWEHPNRLSFFDFLEGDIPLLESGILLITASNTTPASGH